MCQGEKYGKKTDVWALGILLYRLCCLDYPFQGKNLYSLVTKITSQKHKAKDVPKIYSQDLQNIVAKLLKKDPDARPTLR